MGCPNSTIGVLSGRGTLPATFLFMLTRAVLMPSLFHRCWDPAELPCAEPVHIRGEYCGRGLWGLVERTVHSRRRYQRHPDG